MAAAESDARDAPLADVQRQAGAKPGPASEAPATSHHRFSHAIPSLCHQGPCCSASPALSSSRGNGSIVPRDSEEARRGETRPDLAPLERRARDSLSPPGKPSVVRIRVLRAVGAADHFPVVGAVTARAGRQRLDRLHLDFVAAVRATVGAGGDVAADRGWISHFEPPFRRQLRCIT
jgi:hypothetical protein